MVVCLFLGASYLNDTVEPSSCYLALRVKLKRGCLNPWHGISSVAGVGDGHNVPVCRVVGSVYDRDSGSNKDEGDGILGMRGAWGETLWSA